MLPRAHNLPSATAEAHFAWSPGFGPAERPHA